MKVAVFSTIYNNLGCANNILERYPDLKKLSYSIDHNNVLIMKIKEIADLEIINKITKNGTYI